jgi:hypothetical protein
MSFCDWSFGLPSKMEILFASFSGEMSATYPMKVFLIIISDAVRFSI